MQDNLSKMNFFSSLVSFTFNMRNELVIYRVKLLLQLEKAVLNLLCSFFSSAEVVLLLFNKYVIFLFSIMSLDAYYRSYDKS